MKVPANGREILPISTSSQRARASRIVPDIAEFPFLVEAGGMVVRGQCRIRATFDLALWL